MEPSEFNERLDELIREALDSGLHPSHVVNAFDARREIVEGEDGWEYELESRLGYHG